MEHLKFRCLQCEEARDANDSIMEQKQILWSLQMEEFMEHGKLYDKWFDGTVFGDCKTKGPGPIEALCDRDQIVRIMLNIGLEWGDLIPQLDWNELYERDRQLAASEILINEKDNSKSREVTTQ